MVDKFDNTRGYRQNIMKHHGPWASRPNHHGWQATPACPYTMYTRWWWESTRIDSCNTFLQHLRVPPRNSRILTLVISRLRSQCENSDSCPRRAQSTWGCNSGSARLPGVPKRAKPPSPTAKSMRPQPGVKLEGSAETRKDRVLMDFWIVYELFASFLMDFGSCNWTHELSCNYPKTDKKMQ